MIGIFISERCFEIFNTVQHVFMIQWLYMTDKKLESHIRIQSISLMNDMFSFAISKKLYLSTALRIKQDIVNALPGVYNLNIAKSL